jgi:hypothetical protein
MVRRLPSLKVSTQDEEFSTDLVDRDVLVFDNPAEMTRGESRQPGCVRNI